MQARHRRRYDSKPIRAAVEMLESRLLLTSVVVNSVSDAIGGSLVTLRDAIADANKSTTPTTITFDPGTFSSPQTILLANDVLELTNTKEATTIVGPARGVTVNGKNNLKQVLLIDAKVGATLENMTIAGDQSGGGIENSGTLTLTDLTVSGNANNAEDGLGGGISNSGTLTLSDSTVSGNIANYFFGWGGGISNSGILTVTGSTVSGNVTEYSYGGGISNTGTLTVTGSTVSENAAYGAADGGYGSGGGIFNKGTLTLNDSTLSGNDADLYGGGLENWTNETANLNNVTVSGNKGGVGAGIDNDLAPISIANSIIAANIDTNGGDPTNYPPDFSGAANSFGHNLIGVADGSTGWNTSDQTGTAAHPISADLGPLADNGGPTATMLPLPGSPAINGGSNALIPTGVTTDQRGLPRTYGGTVDIGAVETQPTIIASELEIDGVTPHGTFIAGRNVEGFLGLFEPIDTTGPYTVAVNWGDGTASTSFSVTANASGFTEATAYHTYKSTSSSANVNGTLSFTVTDAKGVKSNSSGYGYTLTPAVATNSFSGEVFFDANDDGKLGSTESGIANIVVYDDINNDGVLDGTEPNVTTSSTGAFTLNVPGTGAGVIRTEGVSPDTQTTPASNAGYKVTLAGSTTQSGLNFGYYEAQKNHTGFPTTITGTLYDDANKNGKKDAGELPLGGWEVYNDANNNGKLDPDETAVFTNAAGLFSIGVLGTGTAILREVLPARWSQTTPASSAAIHVTLAPKTMITGKNFGDYTAVKYLSTVATTSGLAAWWTFDTASQANSIVNGITGTLNGGAKITTTAGAPITGDTSNTGLSLNGTSAFVNTDLTTQDEFTTAATVNVWIDLGSTAAKSGHIYTIAAKSQYQNDMDLQLESDGKIHFYTDTGSSASFTPSSLTGWHMLTAEFDTVADTRKIYWDGKLVVTTTTGPHIASTGAFSIGASDVWAGRYYDGSIDEVSLWNRALTAAEILAIYNASK